jgi:hypothetical protein
MEVLFKKKHIKMEFLTAHIKNGTDEKLKKREYIKILFMKELENYII